MIQATNQVESRNRIIQEHLPLVKQVARRFRVGRSSPIDMADLVQYGVIGLIDAAEKFDQKRGASFTSYARFRIRGSILDGLRHVDFVPRSVRRKRRELLAATNRVEQACGGQAAEEEVAQEMDMNPEELRKLLDSVQATAIASIEEMTERGAEVELAEAMSKDGEDSGPEKCAFEHERAALLTEAIERLPAKERLVLSLYYFEECTMREVGDVLGVTESRVSQLHAKAVRRLQLRLREPLGLAV